MPFGMWSGSCLTPVESGVLVDAFDGFFAFALRRLNGCRRVLALACWCVSRHRSTPIESGVLVDAFSRCYAFVSWRLIGSLRSVGADRFACPAAG